MAAEALLGVVFDKFLCLTTSELSILSGITGKKEKLSNTVEVIKAVLEDAEEQQWRQPHVKKWLRQLKNAVYVLDDVLEECSMQSPQPGCLSYFKLKSIMLCSGVGHRLNEMIGRLDQIAKARKDFFLTESPREGPSEVTELRQTSSIITQPHVYGRDEDKEKIIEFFLCSIDPLPIYAIVGLGGVGKTTLAQLVYNDQKREFGLSPDKWDVLKFVLLSCRSKGASILVTTRDMDVANIMGAHNAHHLSGISENDCWSLFRQRAFGPDNDDHIELVEIGKEIVKKCGGSPLAALALGGLMRSKKGLKEWQKVEKSKVWALPGENILLALRLSYSHLTPAQKQCFAFCAIFPKGGQIMKEDLIHLWMANGFISSGENSDIEDIGNMIWNKLYQISFFQEVKANGESGDIYFKMPDLVHELAQSITEPECMFLENESMSDLSSNTHHIGFTYGGGPSPFKKGALDKVVSLRTLYQLESGMAITSIWLPTYRSLRVLSICTDPYKLSLLGNMINLRYLELYKMRIEAIPKSIYNLQKLEILKLRSIRRLDCLPKHLSCLKNLRHLVIIKCDSLSYMFPDIHNLSHLRTLSLYIVNSEEGHSLTELCGLKLGGKLSIDRLNNVHDSSEAQKANLKAKKDLEELRFSWFGRTKPLDSSPEKVLEALQPHSNLKMMAICGYEGSSFPSWMGDNSVLSNLVSLQLYKCNNCQQLSLLGKLTSLRKLHLSVMNYVQYIDDDECYDGVEVRAFPSLEELRVERLPNLQRLLKVEKGKMFPHLSNLSVQFCPKLQWPFLPHVKTLKVNGCNNELLRSISHFNSLNYLCLYESENLTSFPDGMMNNMTCLKTLIISDFQKLKELPDEITRLKALESMEIRNCYNLVILPEKVLEALCSLRTLMIYSCPRLRPLPESVRQLTSLEVLSIEYCPTLQRRCKEGTGIDWQKIAHIPKVTLYPLYDEETPMMRTRSSFRNQENWSDQFLQRKYDSFPSNRERNTLGRLEKVKKFFCEH